MKNIGRIITDSYCNGYFGREYDFSGSEIIAEGDEFLVIRKEDGRVAFCDFQKFDWNINEDGTLSSRVSNVTCLSEEERQELIDSWCGGY